MEINKVNLTQEPNGDEPNIKSVLSDNESIPLLVNSFFCNICYEDFQNYIELENHLQEWHPEQQKLEDDHNEIKEEIEEICPNQQPNDLQEEDITKWFDIEECENEPSTSTENKEEVRTWRDYVTENLDSEAFTCAVCKTIFIQPRALKDHTEKDHPSEILYSCIYCKIDYKDFMDLFKHLRKHDQAKRFTCKLCGRNFFDTRVFRIHLRNAHIARANCKMCNKSYTSAEGLKYHMFTHTGERPFKCEICNRKFITKRNLKIHLITHSDDTPYKCLICDSAFKSKRYLDAHLERHTVERRFICNICNGRFKGKRDLSFHMVCHQEKSFNCEVCDQKFARKVSFIGHMKTHTGEKPFKCDECGTNFSKKFNLKKHIRIHTGEKPYSCTHCDKKFRTLYHLDQHLRVHTGERPYHCKLCDSKFKTIGHLKQHQNTHKS